MRLLKTTARGVFFLLRFWAVSLLLVLGVGTAFVLRSSSTSATLPVSTKVGIPAPNFVLERVGGGQISLAQYRGKRVLLGFLNFESDPSGRIGNPSRGQVVFLSSMARQHAGLEIVLLDATKATGGKALSLATLDAFRLTWHLENMPLLTDDAVGSTAHLYGVTQAPSTFLVGPDGTLERIWSGFVPAQTLALALDGG